MQIAEGEVLSAPAGTATFWVDSKGQPHIDETTPDFTVTWPDGSSSPLVLNATRESDEVALYTSALGRSTRAERGREITLAPAEAGQGLSLGPGAMLTAKVAAVRNGSDSEIPPTGMILSVGPAIARELPAIAPGAILKIRAGITPNLESARVAISGGPILVRSGKAEGFGFGVLNTFARREISSQSRRHPRSAIGWNEGYYFLVEVDGRQSRSVGMTCAELGALLVKLGCTEGMNLDGGGSATLWFKGRVRNRPCEGGERQIANALLFVEMSEPAKTASTGGAQ